MADLPTGTVTFLFTDTDRSTRRWEEHPEVMRTALARRDAILGVAVETHGGVVFKTVGDAFCAVFSTAPDALRAILAARRVVQAEDWGDPGPLLLRAAMHTGTAVVHNAGFFGPAVNWITRLLAAGHGGQTLVSQTTAELIREMLPEGVTLRDLGQHRLKDLTRSEHVYQIVTPDLPTDFPALNTLDRRPKNLPIGLMP